MMSDRSQEQVHAPEPLWTCGRLDEWITRDLGVAGTRGPESYSHARDKQRRGGRRVR